MTPDRERRQQALLALRDATVARDAERVAAAYSAGADLQIPGMPGASGRDGIRAHAGEWFRGFSDLAFAWGRVFDVGGGALVAEWGWTGTGSGPFMGKPAIGKRAGVLGASLLWFDGDGRIREEHRYSDAATVAGQLGLLKDNKHFRPIPELPRGPEWLAASGRPEEKRNIEPVAAIHRAVGEKDEKAYFAALTDDVFYDDLTRPEPMVGRKDGEKELAAFLGAFPDVRFQHLHEWAAGDHALVASEMTGTLRGPPGTKWSVRLHVLDLARITGGRCSAGMCYGNRFEMWNQLGFTDPSAPPHFSPWR